jgi:peptidyl-tRNA hydrolase
MDRLYIVTRSDLPPGAEVAQSCHALRAFVAAQPELDAAWHAAGGNLVCLSVPAEDELERLLARAGADGVRSAEFREVDFGGQLTAIALEASARTLVSSLPLALRPARAAA